MSAHMSGWDVSSTPTWGPQDGPEDTQAFTGQDFGGQDFGRGGPSSPEAGGFPGESQAGGPPPEFFGQEYGQEQELGPGGFPQRTPGGSFQNLPRRESRGRHSSAPGGGYGQDNGFGSDNGFASGNGFGQESAYGHDGAFGQENGYGGQEGGAFGQEGGGAFGQEGTYGQDSAYGQGWGGAGAEQPDSWGPGGQDNDGGWGRGAGRSAAPWDERPQQDPGYQGQDGQEFGQQEFGQQDLGRQDYTRQAPGFAAQDYEGQDFNGQQGFGPREPQGFGRGDEDARMDPALQDFFAPQRGGTSGYPGQGPGPTGEPRDPRYRPPTDGWENPGRPQPPRNGTGPRPMPRTGTGPRPMPRGPRREDPEPRGGLGMRGLIAIGVVVALIIVVAVVLITHKSGGGSPTASNTPAGTATTPAAKPSASKSAGSGAATSGGGAGATTAAYTLSTPATAGGYPMGQNPHFVATATATAAQITTAIASGGGGKATGNPVSASYQLPASQVITFVGYQGTFTPAKVKTILTSLGSDPNTYPTGPNGGILGCANTTTAPDGAVCVWATSTTLGITEFFTATGPETLNSAQSKGASDTLSLRSGVEKKKS
jgi:hypothetical protein